MTTERTITIKTLKEIEKALPRLQFMNVENAIMRRAWSLVEPSGDWKNRVAAKVSQFDLDTLGMDIEIVARAIAYMTATQTEIVELPNEGAWLLTAPGYRAGPAGP